MAIANQKGGVGKTTTAVNLCAALNQLGHRTLLVDADPQGNATSAMGIDKNRVTAGTYRLLTASADPSACVTGTKYGDVIASNRELSGAMIELVDRQGREFVLKDALEKLRPQYDTILIDCPPSLELLTLNALCAADAVLIPMQCEYFALEGLADLVGTVKVIKRKLNPGIQVEGVLLTMYDGRTNLCTQVAGEVKKYFREKVYRTVIPRNIRLSEAPSHGKPVTAYQATSRGAVAYVALAQEYLEREERENTD